MTDIAKKLYELFVLLQQTISKYDAELAERKKKLDSQDEGLVEKAKDLLSREAKISVVENLLTLKDQATKEKREADELLSKVRSDRDEFEKKARKDREQMANDTKAFLALKHKSESDEAMRNKEWAALRKEQTEWKAKFIEEIKNKVR